VVLHEIANLGPSGSLGSIPSGGVSLGKIFKLSSLFINMKSELQKLKDENEKLKIENSLMKDLLKLNEQKTEPEKKEPEKKVKIKEKKKYTREID
jgi:regulator of replication initiation timing